MALKLINTVVNKVTQILAASAGTITDITDLDNTYDQRIYGISVNSDDSANQDLVLYLHDGANSRPLGTIQVPLNSGNTNAVAALNVPGHANIASIFREKDNAGITFLNVKSGYKLQAKIVAATSNKQFNITVFGGKYDG